MARHHRFSKRSRESRKAMIDGSDEEPDYSDALDGAIEDWRTAQDEPDPPPGPPA